RFLSRVVERGGKACVMEVSSHALALGRVDGVEFDVAIFTNLTQDHLDFHQSMDQYRDAKAKLFTVLGMNASKRFSKRAIVNADDPTWEKIVEHCSAPVWTYSAASHADIYADGIHSDAAGSRFD